MLLGTNLHMLIRKSSHMYLNFDHQITSTQKGFSKKLMTVNVNQHYHCCGQLYHTSAFT